MKTSITFIFAVIFIIALLFRSEIEAQTSPEIERLTTAIAKTPDNELLYIERGTLYTWNNRWIGPNVASANSNKVIDENRLKALADADMAIKKNERSYKAFAFRAYLIGQIGVQVKRTGHEQDREMAASLRNESNIIANILKFDLSGQKTITPPYSSDPIQNVIVKGDRIGLADGFDSLLKAKEFAKKRQEPKVLMLNKVSNRYFLYEAYVTENIYPNVQLAETPFRRALKGKSTIPLTYEALKIEPEYSVQPMPANAVLDKYKDLPWQFVDVLDADGLSVIKSPTFQLLNGSKGVRLLFDNELSKGNVNEALKIYNWHDKRNTANNSNDLDVVKITRKTNLSKIYQYADTLRPFVEKEMTRWNYSEADRTAVRGIKPNR